MPDTMNPIEYVYIQEGYMLVFNHFRSATHTQVVPQDMELYG
jgi:hypothetical protein